ncbi:unnamed protein product [Ectocarpus sp. CCAP 1310/34]|nr:unnamed protein product [Ectocarpus sp. CCAP 1310/34]
MGNLMSRKKKREREHVTDQDRAVLDLKNSRDRLTRYQKKLDLECGKLQAQAAAMVKEKRKDRALLLLKIKKLKQDQADKASSQLLSVHQMMDTIDWETQQLQVFKALKEGNVALNKLHEEMPLDKVEELMADTAESIAMEEEISKAIGGSWTDANEEDLLAELAELESEAAPEPVPATEPEPAPATASEPVPATASEPVAAAVPAAAEASKPSEETAAQEASSLEELLPEAPTEAPVVVPTVTDAAEPQQEEERPTLVPA